VGSLRADIGRDVNNGGSALSDKDVIRDALLAIKRLITALPPSEYRTGD